MRLDGLNVVTQGRTNPAWVATLAPWKKGDVYDPDKVAKLEQRLRDVGVYDSITVALAPADKTVDGLRPVIVSLGDRPPHTIELGGGYATTEGAGLDAKWILYNRFRRADTLTLTARLAQIQQKLDVELDLPDWRRADQILKLGGDIFGDETPAYNDAGAEIRADVERHWTKTTYITLGGAVDFDLTHEKTAINANGIAVGQTLKLAILSGLGAFTLDRSNDPLNPTRGWRLQAQAEPTFVTGDRTLPYVKVQAQASAYLPVGPGTVLAARIKLGSILGGSIPEVPADRRFFAGGGGSVRGFSYQGVGPQLSDGTPIGGLSLFESSFEVRQRRQRTLGRRGLRRRRIARPDRRAQLQPRQHRRGRRRALRSGLRADPPRRGDAHQPRARRSGGAGLPQHRTELLTEPAAPPPEDAPPPRRRRFSALSQRRWRSWR